MDDFPLIAVVGPTGSGKSDLALNLAEELGGEIVNCDSVQLYRHLNIGSAKTPVQERRGIPHHLIDVLDPDQEFTAGDYSRAAREVLAEIASRGRVPILAGGTGFYVRALLDGLFQGPARDDQLRQRLARRKRGSVHRLLSRFDPTAASRIHPNDLQKSIRALEVCLLTKQPLTVLFHERETQPISGFRVFKIGLNPPRLELAAKIDQRCVEMFERGLVEETRNILHLGYSPNAKALSSIGYREALRHLGGELSLDEAIAHTQAATRQYAKRQRTWFRKEPDIWWIEDFGSTKKIAEMTVHHLRVDINFV